MLLVGMRCCCGRGPSGSALRLQAQEEVDRVLGEKAQPEVADYQQLKYLLRCVNESMRLYPHPPVLLRRAQIQDELPGRINFLLRST